MIFLERMCNMCVHSNIYQMKWDLVAPCNRCSPLVYQITCRSPLMHFPFLLMDAYRRGNWKLVGVSYCLGSSLTGAWKYACFSFREFHIGKVSHPCRWPRVLPKGLRIVQCEYEYVHGYLSVSSYHTWYNVELIACWNDRLGYRRGHLI